MEIRSEMFGRRDGGGGGAERRVLEETLLLADFVVFLDFPTEDFFEVEDFLGCRKKGMILDIGRDIIFKACEFCEK